MRKLSSSLLDDGDIKEQKVKKSMNGKEIIDLRFETWFTKLDWKDDEKYQNYGFDKTKDR